MLEYTHELSMFFYAVSLLAVIVAILTAGKKK